MSELAIKTGFKSNITNDKNKYVDKYLSKIGKFTDEEKKYLINHINNIHIENIINQSNIGVELSNDQFNTLHNQWNIVKTTNKLEFGFPYTLGNFIFMPESFVKITNNSNYNENNSMLSNDNSNTINKTLKLILVHEKLHIFQRNYQMLYNNLYKNLYGEYLLSIDYENLIIDDVIDKYITNPDSNTTLWIIQDPQNNEYYFIPYMLDNSKNYVINNVPHRLQKINTNNNDIKYKITTDTIPKINLKYSELFNNNINLAHPNETFVDVFIQNNL